MIGIGAATVRKMTLGAMTFGQLSYHASKKSLKCLNKSVKINLSLEAYFLNRRRLCGRVTFCDPSVIERSEKIVSKNSKNFFFSAFFLRLKKNPG